MAMENNKMQGTKTYNWTTPRGAKIKMSITVEHITKDKTSADGWEMEVSCDKWRRTIDEIKVNGKDTKLKQLHIENGVDCVLIDQRGKDRVLVAIPPEIANEIFGEERESIARSREIAKKYEDHYNAVRRMMNK